MVRFVVRADQNIVQGQPLHEQRVHPVQFAARQIAARQAWLIGRRQQNVSGRLQFLQWLRRRRVYLKLVERQRRDLMTTLDLRQIQDAVSLKKNTGLHARSLSIKTAEVSAG